MFLKILDHSSVVPDLNKLQKITHLTFNYRLGPTYHAMTKVSPARPAPSAQQKLLRSPLSHAYPMSQHHYFPVSSFSLSFLNHLEAAPQPQIKY